MNVADLARTRRGEIQTDLATLLRAGMSLQREMAEIDTFLKVYDRLTEPRPNATDGQAAEYAVVTPAAAERVTAEDVHASSAPSQANAGDEATVREEVQPAPMAEVEPVSRLTAGRTADAGEAGSGLGASPAPVSPEWASEEVGGVASACSASAAGSEIPERRELDVDADAIGVPAGETASDLTTGHMPTWPLTPADDRQVAPLPPETVDTPEQFVESPPDPVRSEADARQGLTLVAPGATLFQLVKSAHDAHPDWTATQIAEAIGRKYTSVSATLAVVRRGAKPSTPVTESPPTLGDRIRGVLDGHPDFTARQIADELDTDQKHVVAAAKRYGIAIRKLTPEELLEARRRGGAMGGALGKQRREATYPVEAREPPPAPTPPPEPERPPATSGVVTKPMVRAPRGTQFRLRTGRGEGKYLHQSGVGLVPGRTYAWMGSESQLLAVRQKFPEARDLYEEIVEKEAAKV